MGLFGTKKTDKKKVQSSQEELTKGERLEQGQVFAKVIIEVLGRPKEHVAKSIKEFTDKIKEDKRYDMLNVKIAKPKEVESMFSVYAELDIWFKKLINVLDMCYDYMPSSIEIIEPTELKMKSTDLSGFFNDTQARLHQIDMIFKNTKAENEKLKINIHNLLKNALLISLRTKKGKTIEQLSGAIGISKENLSKLIVGIIKEEERIKKKDDMYYLELK